MKKNIPSRKKKEQSIRRKKVPDYSQFNSYIKKILKDVHRDTGIDSQALHQLNRLVKIMGNLISDKAIQLVREKNKSTVTDREINFACSIILKGELSKHANSEGRKATDENATNDYLHIPSTRVRT